MLPGPIFRGGDEIGTGYARLEKVMFSLVQPTASANKISAAILLAEVVGWNETRCSSWLLL